MSEAVTFLELLYVAVSCGVSKVPNWIFDAI